MKHLTRTYYRVLDFVQRTWRRFRATEAGAATVWVAPRLFKAVWFLMKCSLFLGAAVFVMMFGVLFGTLLMITGNGKEFIKSATKLATVLIGFVAADRLLERRLAAAATTAAAITKAAN